jgi:hypothetical protein
MQTQEKKKLEYHNQEWDVELISDSDFETVIDINGETVKYEPEDVESYKTNGEFMEEGFREFAIDAILELCEQFYEGE